MKALEYPFDSDYLLKKSKRIRKELLADGSVRLQKKIAVLGGSTTHDIVRILELFLLHYGIEPVFYESEYARYWQDAMFPEEPLQSFAPDIVFVHTSCHNITDWPCTQDDESAVSAKLDKAFSHFTQMWERIKADYHCPVIQNNFEYPPYRLYGNRDAYDVHGRVRFVNELNARFAEYARTHEGFYLNDIAYLSALYGLEAWSEPSYWYMYKYALAVPAIPTLAYSVANIVKSIFGKNKKALVLDMDNTLWGGVIGDDGVEAIAIGQETAEAEAFTAFQEYVKAQKDIGIVLNVASKNEEENALAGLRHPDSVLREDDFVYIRANWDPKSENVKAIAAGMNVLPESLVFVDDNPAEREIVTAQVKGVSAPALDVPEHYIRLIDRNGFFEATAVSEDDAKRAEMYRDNLERQKLEETIADYAAYLKSLEMHATIEAFTPLLFERIAQLTNKSNQFNLTTKRFTVDEIKAVAEDETRITLYGRLVDKFGDNGVVSLVIAHVREGEDEETDPSLPLEGAHRPGDGGFARTEAERRQMSPQATDEVSAHIELWLMSCRVLKRDMEFAMMDALVDACRTRGVKTIYGYYYPTAKNRMVEGFYEEMGFERVKALDDGRTDTVWKLEIPETYEKKNRMISVE